MNLIISDYQRLVKFIFTRVNDYSAPPVPPDLAERLYATLEKSKTNDLFEIKVLKMNFISQLVAAHKVAWWLVVVNGGGR